VGGGIDLPGFVILKLPVAVRVLYFCQKKVEDCSELSAGQKEEKLMWTPGY
jgi:hypothetical protein